MNRKVVQADLMLLLTAVIWGFAFVAQRVGMEYLGPFTFNAVRFALGSLSLLPLIFVLNRKRDKAAMADRVGGAETTHGVSGTRGADGPSRARRADGHLISGTLAAGSMLFIAASLQQIGIQFTTAGKAGFLTGLYVVLVPIIGALRGKSTGKATWVGAVLAVVGIYLLSAPEKFGAVNKGDILVLIGAVFWSLHVLIIDHFAKRLDPLKLSAGQFAWCALFSLIVALFTEHITWAAMRQAALPILYGGLASVGVGYTLQVVAQRDAPPAHSAVLMCLEGAFATLGGVLLLSEQLTARTVAGSALMLVGMLATQWDVIIPS